MADSSLPVQHAMGRPPQPAVGNRTSGEVGRLGQADPLIHLLEMRKVERQRLSHLKQQRPEFAASRIDEPGIGLPFAAGGIALRDAAEPR